MGRIDGKIIWLTGASSGIGEALTYQLDKKKCKLVLSSRKEEELQRVKANCTHHENIKIISLDLENLNELPEKAKAAIEAFGHMDMLINNAGISQRSEIINTNINVYKRLMDINYLGTIALSKAVLPYFVKAKNGHIVTVSSLMGKFAGPLRSGYCGSKHALHGFFDVLRMEHEKDGINVTMICPGYVQTNIDKNALTADGSPQEKHDVENQNGLAVDIFVKKMIRAIERLKYEAYLGKKEVMGIYLKRFFPKLLHRLVLKSTA
jgi:short-subunit dehydrogenase